MRITVCARAKINWSLDIRANREDGYHELDMLMQRIDLCDEMTFERARWLSLTVDGTTLPVGGRNLVVRAANALNLYMGKRYGARITLNKRIPVRAGLGGGSADCAATLTALNRLWNLRLNESTLMSIGAKLGADVPFCVAGGFARVSGVGERVITLKSAQSFPLVLLHVGEGLSTAKVFSRFDSLRQSVHVDTDALTRAILARDLEAMAALSKNALEDAAIAMMPQIGSAMERMRKLGARVVRMSGSGSAVYGVFRTAAEALAAHDRLPGSIFTWTC